MHALDRLGIDRGERVATLAWNTYRHLEAYFAVPNTERVLHTLNLRLSPEDLAYIIGHADDRAILVDPDLVPLLEKIGPEALAKVEHIVVLADEVPEPTLARAADRLRGPHRRRARVLSPPRDPRDAPRAASATRRAPRAGRRARSTPTARRSCTRWPR